MHGKGHPPTLTGTEGESIQQDEVYNVNTMHCHESEWDKNNPT